MANVSNTAHPSHPVDPAEVVPALSGAKKDPSLLMDKIHFAAVGLDEARFNYWDKPTSFCPAACWLGWANFPLPQCHSTLHQAIPRQLPTGARCKTKGSTCKIGQLGELPSVRLGDVSSTRCIKHEAVTQLRFLGRRHLAEQFTQRAADLQLWRALGGKSKLGGGGPANNLLKLFSPPVGFERHLSLLDIFFFQGS